MPKSEVDATVDVVLEPDLVACLSAKLTTLKSLELDVEMLTAAIEREKSEILQTLVLHNIKRCRVDGTPMCIVEGTSTRMDKLKFVALGGSLQMLKDASVSKPKKPYLKIGEEKTSHGYGSSSDE